MRLRPCAAVTLAASALLLGTMPARADAPAFGSPVQLKGATGGEPSIVTDGKGNVYVTGPQGIPSAVNNQQPGVAVWVSNDHAQTFSQASLHGSYLGGGDSDVEMGPDGNTVYIADLEAAATAICDSADHGKTWSSIGPLPDPGNCGGVVAGQAGPSNDRQWLTSGPGQPIYLTYHEFVSAQPVMFRSDSGGADDFTAGPCGPLVTDPNIEANVPQDITGGTLVSKPVLDSAGNVYVMFTTTTQQQNAQALPGSVSGTFSQVYLAVSTDHCASFTDHTVFDGSKVGTNSVQFGDIFNDLVIDSAGNLYAVASGYVDSTPPASTTANIYLLTSADHGATWTKPQMLTAPTEADMLPAATAAGPGELAIGYFRTTNGVTNPNDAKGVWTYTVAETGNALAAPPAFSFTDVGGPNHVWHSGDICNSGLLCGTGAPGTGSDRSLLDFSSATVDSDGCPIVVFAGNPGGSPTRNYVSKQTAGCFTAAIPPSTLPETPLTWLLPVVAAIVAGGVLETRRRRRGRATA